MTTRFTITLNSTDMELLATALREKSWSAKQAGLNEASENYRKLFDKMRHAWKLGKRLD